jgi:hypothetical protein
MVSRHEGRCRRDPGLRLDRASRRARLSSCLPRATSIRSIAARADRTVRVRSVTWAAVRNRMAVRSAASAFRTSLRRAAT